MKTLTTLAAALLATGAASAEVGATCAADSDCAKGEACAMAPCPAIACDPNDAECVDPGCEATGQCVLAEENPVDGSACKTDSDCGEGYLCQIVGSSGSTGCACPSDVPAEECDCPPPEPSVDIYGCVPKPCAVDADCGEGQKCVTIELGCPDVAVACTPDGECPPAEAPECDTSTTTQCQYDWEGTCENDADCGAGFACKAYESCTCSGGAASPASEGDDGSGAPPPAEEPSDCVCEPSAEKYCELLVVECESDDDCAPGLLCGSSSPVDMGVPCFDDNGDGSCDEGAKMPCADSDGDGNCDESADVPKTCGFGWKNLAGTTGEPSMNPGGGEGPTEETSGGDGGGDGSAPVDAENDGLPTAPNTGGGDADGTPSAGGNSGGASAGCTATTGSSENLFGLLALFAFTFVARRSRVS